MSNIRQEIIEKIHENGDMEITGNILQEVLLDMFDRDVFLTEIEYNALVESGQVDPDKIYHVFED